MKFKEYNNKLAEEYVWGGPREISLVENIFTAISKTTNQIIDIGCGDGYLLYYLNKKLNCQFLGFDLSKLRLQRLKKTLPVVKCIEGDITKNKFEDNEFETVLCSEVLEHVPDFKKALSELIRITKKELIITIPNDENPKKVICPKCGTIHSVDGHVNKFDIKLFKKLILEYPNARITQTKKFNTIYSYNKTTLNFPSFLRKRIDRLMVSLERYIPFFKPNYLLIKIIKIKQ